MTTDIRHTNANCPMTIKNCIIHKIDRAAAGKEVKLQLKAELNHPEGSLVSTLEQLKLTFQRSTQKQYGLFDPNQSDNPLPALLQEAISEKAPFATISHRLMNQLKIMLDKNNEPFSAHALFMMETLVEQDFFYILWIEHTEAAMVNSELEVNKVDYINTSRLKYALKIDMEQWKVEGWDQYASLVINRGNKDLAEAFLGFTGFISSVDLKLQTENFLNLVDDYTETKENGISKELKSKIVEYCIDQDSSGNPVDIQDLSSQLDQENPDAFKKFVHQQQPETKNEIYTDRASLKKYVRFFGRDKNLSISFSSDMYGESILYNEKEGTLTFREIPKSLKAQLSKYSDKG